MSVSQKQALFKAYGDLDSSKGRCSICLEEFNGKKLVVGHVAIDEKVSHIFHQKCIQEYRKLNLNSTCPLCRSEFSNKSVSVIDYEKFQDRCLLEMCRSFMGVTAASMSLFEGLDIKSSGLGVVIGAVMMQLFPDREQGLKRKIVEIAQCSIGLIVAHVTSESIRKEGYDLKTTANVAAVAGAVVAGALGLIIWRIKNKVESLLYSR